MYKVVDGSLMVEFYDRSRTPLSGKLLIYEVVGEACVRVSGKNMWVPFSRLTRASRKRVLKARKKRNAAPTRTQWADPKIGVIVTLGVIWAYLGFMI